MSEALKHPRLSFEKSEDGTNTIRYAMQGWGDDVVCSYWRETKPNRDPWTYKLAWIEGKGGTFTHVSESGCINMIVRFLVELGLIQSTEDNSHLDEKDTSIAIEIEANREAFTGKPRVGDFVIMPDGTLQRCSHAWPHGMQTSEGGSFSIANAGRAGFSGGLNRARLWEYFKETGEIRMGKFWFFSHNHAQAHNGVDVFLPCRVYRLEPFSMSEEEARAHPKAKAVEQDTWTYENTIHQLMNGAA